MPNDKVPKGKQRQTKQRVERDLPGKDGRKAKAKAWRGFFESVEKGSPWKK